VPGLTGSDPASIVVAMLLRHAIGAALRRIRLDGARTLREVSRAANISMPYLSEIERGRKEPSSEILAGIFAALGLSLVDLLHEATFEELSVMAVVVDVSARAVPALATVLSHEAHELTRAPGRMPQTEISLAAA